MTPKNWTWYLAVGIFYTGLLGLGVRFVFQAEAIRALHSGEKIGAEFEGNDWVTWKDSEAGVVAKSVHPLPFYKPFDPQRIQAGDRIRSIDGTPMTSAEAVEKITQSSPPGKIFVVFADRTDPISLSVERISAYVVNGFRLVFSFNEIGIYWKMSVWVTGVGAFLTLIILVILFPIVRSNWRRFFSLLGLGFTAILFFSVPVIHHLFLVVESELVSTRFEKIYFLLFSASMFAYVGFYFRFKTTLKSLPWLLPSALAAAGFLVFLIKVTYFDLQTKYYHDLLESYAIQFTLWHLSGTLMILLSSRQLYVGRRERIIVWGAMISAMAGVAFYQLFPGAPPAWKEHVLFLFQLLMFFPIIHATFLQLQFGKVSLVVTQTLLYLTFIIVSILLFLLITQIYDYLLPTNQYRRIIEFITFLSVVLSIRLLYISNENKVSRYFVSAQQEKVTRFRAFIARIPQYASPVNLRSDLTKEVSGFFQPEFVSFWWKSDHTDLEGPLAEHQEAIYHQLIQEHAVWSKTKEISVYRFDEALEKVLQKTSVQLISPIVGEGEEYGLLLLGRKRRGVYNLTDLEVISQLIQQTQLTLNVLQLLNREKELLQATYEANLTALRSQINPHFLFNTLNTISALIHDSPDLAESAVEKLAFIFRYTLKVSSQNFVPLSNEIQLVTTYLEIEKIRFGERLEVSIEVEPDTRDILMPAFILQTLTENCIKHGIAKILGKGRVSIATFQEKGFLICEVIDNGPGIDLSRIYKSTGLSNSIARLENMYGMKNLLYFENTGSGTYVRLRIPLELTPELKP
jgi:signal transduction histidine kinase